MIRLNNRTEKTPPVAGGSYDFLTILVLARHNWEAFLIHSESDPGMRYHNIGGLKAKSLSRLCVSYRITASEQKIAVHY